MDPLFFRPILKRIVWGGRRLGDLLGKPLSEHSDYAESWEIADHRSDQSVVEAGPLAGRTLGELVRDHNRPLLGRHAGLEAFPLLLKFLDCHRVLSVQVHPDDHYARQMPTPDLGKTEAWYIVDALPQSRIYAGLKNGVDQRALWQAIQAGQTDEVLHSFVPQVGQCVFIPAGTVHALGGGLVVAEIQQSSNTTFRLFDWNRLGEDGKPRALHLEEALEVTDYRRGPIQVQTPVAEREGVELLVQCDKFVLRQVRLTHRDAEPPRGANGGQPQLPEELSVGGDDRMHLLSVVRGGAELLVAGAAAQPLPLGRSVLIPAAAGPVRLRALRPASTILWAHLP